MSPQQLALVLRLPQKDECQCVPCGGVLFADEPAFKRHLTRRGHAEPAAVGLVERVVAGGAVWGIARMGQVSR